MEIRQLRYFDRIVMRGSFTQAAQSLGIKEPTLSEQIKRLEQELGTELFDRSIKPIGLTPSGEVVRRGAHRIFLDLREVQAELAQLAGINPGRVSLGTLNSSEHFMAQIVASFVERFPSINVSIQEETKDQLLPLVQSGSLDACVRAAHSTDDQVPEGLSLVRLFSFEFVFVVRRNHPFAGRKTVSLAELRQEPLVVPTGDTAAVMIEALKHAGLAPVRVVTPNKVAMVPDLVMQGAGIGFAPNFVIDERYPNLSTFTVNGVACAYDYQLVWATARELSQAADCFLDFVRNQQWGLDTFEYQD